MQENKKQRKKWNRTHCSCAVQKRIACDICVARHGTLSSKITRAINIDYPRQMKWVNRNARSRGILVQVFQLNVTLYKNAKEESRNGRDGKKEQYLDVKGGHKVSMVELIIVQLLPKPIDIGHTRTPMGLLDVVHRKRGKHELRLIHRYL